MIVGGAPARTLGWPVLRGVAAILFGLLALLRPSAALAALVLAFAIWAVADSVLQIGLAMGGRRGEMHRGGGSYLMGGLVGIAAAAFAFTLPGVMAIALAASVAGWSVVRGVEAVAAALGLRGEGPFDRGWVVATRCLVSLAFAVALIALPEPGAFLLLRVLGLSVIIAGAVVPLGVHILPTKRRSLV